MYVYHTEYIDYSPGIPVKWDVGYYDPSGVWVSESVHDTEKSAADRVSYLNGGKIKLDKWSVVGYSDLG